MTGPISSASWIRVVVVSTPSLGSAGDESWVQQLRQ